MSGQDSDLLKEIRDRYDTAESEWSEIRDEADEDMKCVAGDPWDEQDRRDREAANRPCLSLDELAQYLNQVINQIRANPRAVKFTPNGNGANDKTAEFYANKMREVEYRSHAQLAYTTAFQNCVERGFGWVRLKTKYESDTSFNQDIWIEDIPNPNMVLPDPQSKRPDGSDLRYLFFRETMPISEFKRRWPKAEVTEFDADARLAAPAWFSEKDDITVAEYWTKEVARTRRLLLLSMGKQPPVEVFEDALTETPDKARILRERTVEEFKVTQYLTNGVEILETTKWKGKYIPFASCFGKVIYLNGKRQILSMTRLARDPYMLYCYYRTCEAELVGMTPKFPYFVYEDQISPDEYVSLQKSLHEPVAVIRVKASIESMPGQLLPHPARQPYEPPIQGLEVGAEAARRAIQAAIMGSPLPTSAQRHNEKSGVALQQIEKSGQIGSFHFNDHYDYMVRQVGVIYEDICDKTLDAARDTDVQDANGKAMRVRVNDPKPTAQQVPDSGQLQQALQAWQARLPKGTEDSVDTKGDHVVTVSSGPAADSQREAVADFIGNLAGIPEVMAKAGDLIVRIQGQTMNLGPNIEELADRLTPPEFKKPKDGEGPDPQQMQQQLAQAGQQVQQLNGMVSKLSMEIKTDQVQTQSKEKIERAKILSNERLEVTLQRMKDATSIAVAKIAAMTKGVVAQNEADLERIALEADAQSQLHQQAHERGLAEVEHQHELEAAQQAHEQALEQGDVSHGQTLEQQQQAAALAPQPEAGA